MTFDHINCFFQGKSDIPERLQNPCSELQLQKENFRPLCRVKCSQQEESQVLELT